VRTTRPRLLLGALVSAATVWLLAGCGSGSRPASAPAPASPTPTHSAAPSSAPQGPPAAGEPCHTRELAAALQQTRPGGGSRYAILTLTNRSDRTCPIRGFPGLQLLDPARQPLPTNVVRDQQQPSQTVQLAPGASVFTTLHWGLVPGDGEPQTTQCEPTPSFLAVTPPDESSPAVAAWTYGPACQHGRIDLPAVAPGTGPAS
jgi:hypothetical protein